MIKRAALRSISKLDNELVQSFLIVAAGFGHIRNIRSVRHLHHPLFKFLVVNCTRRHILRYLDILKNFKGDVNQRRLTRQLFITLL